MFINEQFRLELHWSEVAYTKDGCVFYDAYFCGPVLHYAEKIQENDFINLDFVEQHFIFTQNVFVNKLAWKKVTYEGKFVYLGDCRLFISDEYIKQVPKFREGDYLIIDCSQHDREVHAFNPNYKAFVANNLKNIYTYE